MAASNLFGLTSTIIGTDYAAWFKSANTTVLDTALDNAAAEVCRTITNCGVDPVTVTQVNNPDTYQWLAQTTAYGALAFYGVGIAANVDQARGYMSEFKARVRQLRDNPAEYLVGYPVQSGINTVRAATQEMTYDQVQASKALFWNPLDRRTSFTR